LRRAPVLLLLLALALAACGGSGKKQATTKCPTEAASVSFPLLDPAKPYTIDVRTNLGSFAFALDVKDSPCTTSSFASLVRKKFFDGTRFHRIVPGFVIQGGDPTGTGRGGPGYTVVDIPPRDARYTRGVVAMAKSRDEPPGTSGSQFFIVTAADAGLTPDYALLGKVTSGLAVVERIGRLGDSLQHPTRKISVVRMTVSS
jgi:cyclophilin family peptidyl-prolyl cis-trans isomerase